VTAYAAVAAVTLSPEPASGMRWTLIFAEPEEPSDGPFRGLAAWLGGSGLPEACTAREMINGWYASFPDRNNMVMNRLRSDNDAEVLSATDELYIHHLVSQSCQPRYEEDKTSPDFRLYRSSEYLAGVEVLTLFTEQNFATEISRNSRLVDGINRRVRPTTWYVWITVIRWTNQPRLTEVTTWLQDTISSLPAPAADLKHSDYPTIRYSTAEVELEFTLVPRRRTTAPTATEPIVMAGPAVAQFVRPALRLRNNLSRKAGSKYDHRNQPFAVVVSIRDINCDVEDLVNALYGDDAVTADINNPAGSVQPIRKRNGTFAISPRHPRGRNRRLSCVFTLMRGWMPGSQTMPTVLRFDNPFAEKPFPEDLITADRRMVGRRDHSGVYIGWEQNTASTNLSTSPRKEHGSAPRRGRVEDPL